VPDINVVTVVELDPVDNRILLFTGERARFIFQDIGNLTVFAMILLMIGVSFIWDIDPNTITDIIL
jgi:hypothetical protein